MRIAALSDPHGNAVALEAVIADLKRQSPDAVLVLGDLTMRGPQPKECVDLVRSLNPLAVLRGNYDDLFAGPPWPWFDPQVPKHQYIQRGYAYDCERLTAEDRRWLATLPEHRALVLEGIPVELFHATPTSLREITWPWAPLEELERLKANEQTKLVIFGHIHHAFVRQARGTLVVNPGSAGLPFDGDTRASYAIIDLNGPDIAVQLRRVTYDREKAADVARACGMPDLESFIAGIQTGLYPY